VLSGEMSEELAVAALHAGADDFVLKTRMFRIASALQNSLRAAESRREAHAAVAALADSEARLHALTQHLERAKEDERRAIAQEIHDDIGGALTALKFELVRLSREMEARDGERSTRLDGIQELLESAVIASHRIQHALRPAVLDAGLVAALEWLTRGFSERSGLAVEFQSNCDEFEIEPDRAAALYRVAQEALTNVRKHARGATRVRVVVAAAGGQGVEVSVRDDGRAARSRLSREPLAESGGGLGLVGLRERVEAVGGQLRAQVRPEGGWETAAWLPRAVAEVRADAAGS
jgi:signal transduction histidine kinase